MNTASAQSKKLSRQALGTLIAGFEGLTLNDELREALENGLGGVILFSRNYKDQKQLSALTAAVKSHNREALIAVDQEGGRVTRFAEDFPAFPSPGYFGSRNDLEGLQYATEVTASHLSECGVNCNLIPVCDLQPASEDHVIRARAYSSDPRLCAEAVRTQIRILKRHNLISCAKHFPGLASATGDPHHVVSHSDQGRETFHNRDFIPFAAAIDAGCEMVMPTHLMATQLDKERIATFSSKIIGKELRDHLGFKGLVMSDDLQMLGALDDSDLAGTAIKSLSAGCELLIYGNLTGSMSSLVGELVRRVEGDDELSTTLTERALSVGQFRQHHFG